MNWRLAFVAVPALCSARARIRARQRHALRAVDAGIDYTNNVGGHSAWQMASGFAQGSRWGLKGTEDPGGGYSALFQLENGFNVNNGTLAQGGRMFGRQAYVVAARGSAR